MDMALGRYRKKAVFISRRMGPVFFYVLISAASVFSAASENEKVKDSLACHTEIDTRQRQIRDFIVTNFRPLGLEITIGEGDYLGALCLLLEVTCAPELGSVTELRVLLKKAESASSFAKAVSFTKTNLLHVCA